MEIDGQRYPRDCLLTNSEEKRYIAQHKKLKLLFKKYIGEPILNTFISFPDMKTNYRFRIIDLRHQPDEETPEKILTNSRLW